MLVFSKNVLIRFRVILLCLNAMNFFAIFFTALLHIAFCPIIFINIDAYTLTITHNTIKRGITENYSSIYWIHHKSKIKIKPSENWLLIKTF